MRLDSLDTDQAILAEMGARLERTRLARNLTQLELADGSGVAKRTLERLEAGRPVSLLAFLRVLRRLGLLDGLERALPPPVPSPVERLEAARGARRRGSGRKVERRPEPPTPWRWGDEDASGE